MNILVTGATGFIGRRLAARLSETGHIVSGLSRDPERAATKAPAVRRFFPWQPDAPPPQSALSGVDAVIHLAGETVNGRWSAEKRRRIAASRVDGTRNLVAALALSGRQPALVSASAVGYFGDRGDETLTEASGPGDGFLAGVVQDWEREAVSAERAGCRVALMRFGIVLGPDGGALARLLPLFRLGLGSRLGSGRQWWPWVHVDDAVNALIAAALHPWSGAFNITSPQPVRQQDFASALARALHRPAAAPPVPAFALRVALGGVADELLFSRRAMPGHLLNSGFEFRYPDIGDALTQLVRQEAHHAHLPAQA